MMTLAGKEIIMGVTGSIAAYKAVYLLRELVRLGAGANVVLTEHAQKFVGPLTFRTLSGRPVLTDLFDPQTDAAVEHVELASRCHALIVAPATANLLAKAAHGIADDSLTTLLLATRAPVLIAPAMDAGMWDHPAVVANVATLRARGVTVLEPDAGELASRLAGKGRLPEIDAILETLQRLLSPLRDLAGQRLLITAGPPRGPIDPLRYLSNRSSGKMGYALAPAGLPRGPGGQRRQDQVQAGRADPRAGGHARHPQGGRGSQGRPVRRRVRRRDPRGEAPRPREARGQADRSHRGQRCEPEGDRL